MDHSDVLNREKLKVEFVDSPFMVVRIVRYCHVQRITYCRGRRIVE